MLITALRHFSQQQAKALKDKVFDLLADYGIKLDIHEEMFDLLADVGARVKKFSGLVKFPRKVLITLLERTPKSLTLGARNLERSLQLPRPDGTFYARAGTGVGQETQAVKTKGYLTRG